MAVSIFPHLFAARIRSHDLGCGTRQQAAGVLAGSALEDFHGGSLHVRAEAREVHIDSSALIDDLTG